MRRKAARQRSGCGHAHLAPGRLRGHRRPGIQKVLAHAIEHAAQHEIADGHIRVAGTDRTISYADIAALPGASAANMKAIESFLLRR